ncbi:hypothetical protein ACFLVH_01685 [Chloroflexota bacterium]
MTKNKVLRILALALTLALSSVTLPATPALAESVTLSPDHGEIGDEIEVWGTDFTTSSLRFYFSDERASVGETIDVDVLNYEYLGTDTAVDGIFEDMYFTVPSKLTDGDEDETVRGGTYYFYVTNYSKDILLREAFTVENVAEITLDPDEDIVDTEVEISGTGFDGNEDIIVEYDGDEVDIEDGDSDTDSDGEFACTIIIPESTAGDHTITVTGDDSSMEAEATFTVEPHITISPESGAAGSAVTVSGTGFGDEVDFTITFDGDDVATDETDDNGSFEVSFNAPALRAGSYDVEAEDDDNNSGTVEFTIGATNVNISPTTGYTGIEVTVSGSGFKASTAISIAFDNEVIPNSATTTDGDGSFSTSFTVPVRTTGTYKVKASDGTNTVEVDFSITTGANISPVTTAASPGYVGMPLNVNGDGFTPAGMVTITYDGNKVTTTPVNANGTFSVTFNAPTGKGGSHSIIATDGINSKTLIFYMESNPPQIPPPLKPEMNIKAEAQTYFDWEDVPTDPSGVTYTLQIATDAAFGTIILEKTGLTTSEYTLTKEERLESAGEESPYYWRVKAVDGASNESQWTGKGEFYVGGFSLGIPQNTTYILFGVGVLIIGVLFFWLGRKTAYY